MLKQQSILFTRLSTCVDMILVVIAFFVAYEIRNQISTGLNSVREYIWVLLIILPTWYYLLAKYGLLSPLRRIKNFEIFTRLLSVHFIGGFSIGSVIYLVDRDNFSRGLYLFFLATSLAMLLIEKLIIRNTPSKYRTYAFRKRNILIVGTQKKAVDFSRLVEEHTELGLKIIGFIQVSDEPMEQLAKRYEIFGRLTDMIEVCKTQTVDEVVFCLPKDYLVDIESYLQSLQDLGITTRMVLDFYSLPKFKKDLSFFSDELPIMTFHLKELDAQQIFLKRLLDVTGSVVGLWILILLFPFIAIAIKTDTPGPIFFGQQRVGEGGRLFTCWKFRSMHVDAERVKAELLDQNEMKGAIFKIKNDPRVTSVGRILRKTYLDELPQFWNIFKAEMSLVGTRPPTPEEVSNYENWHRRRISIRPGLTGLWQVSGRSRINDFDQIVELDLKYIDHWSLWLDIKILLKTVYIVLLRHGS